jgi:hypothetical protein
MTVTAILAGYYDPDEQGRRKPESLYGAPARRNSSPP